MLNVEIDRDAIGLQKQGHSIAEFGLAMALHCTPEAALVRLCALAKQGLPEAQVALGQYLLQSRERPADPANAATWFEIAAKAGHAPAMNMLGRCLERGWGVAIDLVAAASWYERAANLDFDWAQYNLGNAMLRGGGTALNRPAAYAWFHRAASQGHAKSMNLVGRFLEEGWGVQADPETAFDWYRRSAEGGDYRGQFNWGLWLARQERKREAAGWFLRAAYHATPDLLPIMAESLGEDDAYPEAIAVIRRRIWALKEKSS